MKLFSAGATFLLLGLCSFNGLGQSNQLMRTDLISPSPTAANLSKYGETPVTYYTGLPNVSIPIFNVTGNVLSVPITLTYNFGGLLPLQKTSWVGLGWSLQAGGVITRTVGDKVEDGSGGYDKQTASNVNPSKQYLVDSYVRNMYDNLPDIYSFNFGNYSGKFICYNQKAYVMPDQKLKVTPGNGGFTITTEDGTKYYFGEQEYTHPRAGQGPGYSPPSHISAWYLTKISNADNSESIMFYYASDGMVEQKGPIVQSYKQYMGSLGIGANPPNSSNVPSVPSISESFPTQIATVRLSSIVSDKFRVDFTPGPERVDLSNTSGMSRALGAIAVYGADDTPVKRLVFNYGYFGSQHKMLKLQSVVDQAFLGDSQLQKYQFEYQNEQSTVGTGSLSQVDKFGYLMGGGITEFQHFTSMQDFERGAVRRPDFNYVSTGALKKITYPTGGSTTFTYEPNLYFDGITYPVIEHMAGSQDRHDDDAPTDTRFTLSNDGYSMMELTIKIDRTLYNPDNHNNLEDDYEIYSVHQDTRGNDVLIKNVSGRANGADDTDTWLIEPGDYIIRAVVDQHSSMVFVKATWSEISKDPVPPPVGPGIRLRGVEHENGFGSTIKKNFSYTREDGFSSGVLLSSKYYSSNSCLDTIYSYAMLGANLWVNYYLVHNSVGAETQGLGLPHYYHRVTEEIISLTDTLRTVYDYDYSARLKRVDLLKKTDFIRSNNTFKPQAVTENFFGGDYDGMAFGGMNVYQSGTRQAFDVPALSEPSYSAEFRVEGVNGNHQIKTILTQIEGVQTQRTETRSYYDAVTHNLTATKSFNSDGSTIYTRYKYAEDYSGISDIQELVDAHMLSPVIEEQVWRKNSTGDSVMIGGKINEYKNKRLFAVHLLESSSGITSLSNETKNALGKYTSLISDNANYKKKIEFTYDNSGRVIKQQQTDQPPVSYLWAFPSLANSGSSVQGKVLPVAEIKNATAAEVFYTSFESAGENITASKTGKQCHSGVYSITGSYTGDYKLTYWKKTGTGEWQLIESLMTNPSTSIQIGDANSLIDEVRLYPAKAELTTYTYFPGVGISSANDANNNIRYYEYDPLGRLTALKDYKGNITESYQYHVKDQIIMAND